MNPKISVIVPVYNIERYLLDCLESIASQTLDGIQVLLIDDGSQDCSGQICRDFIVSHPNFEYYHKENGGTASARNVGLAHAKGEYIGFVDSDDWIEPDMFEIMYQAIKHAEADIVYCKMPGLTDYVDLPTGIYRNEEICNEIYPALLPHVVASGTFRTVDWGNWSRLYRRTMIHDNGICFYEKSRRCEDFAFSVECALHATVYVVLDAGELYHYRPNENSKSRSYTKNMWQSIRSLMTYMVEITAKCTTYDFSNAMQMCIFYFCTQVIHNEMRNLQKSWQVKKIREVVSDPLCINAINVISSAGMNQHYTALYNLVKTENAMGLKVYLKKQAFKRKYIGPALEKVLRNQLLKKYYQKLRGR